MWHRKVHSCNKSDMTRMDIAGSGCGMKRWVWQREV